MPKNLGKNKQDKLTKELQGLGLKEKEALVYIALLGLGEVGTSRIASATELHTQHIYIALEALEAKGLAQHVVKRGRKKFSAKHPHALVRLVGEKKQAAETLSTELEAYAALPREQRFEVFQGNESYVTHEFDLLREAPENSEILIITGKGNRFVSEMGKRMDEYERERIKKKISIRYIGSSEQKEELDTWTKERKLFQYRLLPGLYTGQVDTDIWSMAIGFNIYADPVVSFVHSNEVIAGGYRQFFEVLWKLARV